MSTLVIPQGYKAPLPNYELQRAIAFIKESFQTNLSNALNLLLACTCIRQAVKNPAIDAAGIAALLQARCEKLTEIPEKVDFFDALPDYGVEFFTNKKSKTNPEVSKAMLEAAIPALEAISDWTADAIHDTLIDLSAKLEEARG